MPSVDINAVTGVRPIQTRGIKTDIKGAIPLTLLTGTETASVKGKETETTRKGIINSKTRGSLSFLET